MEESNSILAAINSAIENMTWIEIGAVITGLVYVILAAKENIWCWSFGIISALLSIYLFYTGKLYAESGLYVYYVIAGFYGWYVWQKRKETTISSQENQESILGIHSWSLNEHLVAIGSGIVVAVILSQMLEHFTDAQMPLIDSFTTVFSFIATYMVTRKVLENWLYWIIIDVVTAGMYYHRAYYLYALLMVIYAVIAIVGYYSWLKLQRRVA